MIILRRIFLFPLICSYNFICQTPKVIKVEKSDAGFYFFQKGNYSDTIVKNKSDLFYLVVKDSLKDQLIILIENGQFIKTKNDSIFKLNYIKGIAYECLFEKTKNEQHAFLKIGADRKVKYEFKCLINGVSADIKHQVIFRVKIKNQPDLLLENKFYYK